MSEWWEKASPGGPMVGPSFIRELYPPDAAPEHEPSGNGDDVRAIKRGVARSGHWPWGTFDGAYSNGFAHGRSGNVSENGLAGLQRQNGIQPTGYMGEKTYNLIRSARIPNGLPHAGEPILDATAVKLLEGYAKKKTKPPKLTRKPYPSPNYSSRGSAAVRLIVIHTAEGASTIEELGNFFAQASAGVPPHTGIDDQLGRRRRVRPPHRQSRGRQGTRTPSPSRRSCARSRNGVGRRVGPPPEHVRELRPLDRRGSRPLRHPDTTLDSPQAQGTGRGVCQHADLGDWGGGHWDCGGSFPLADVLARAKELL